MARQPSRATPVEDDFYAPGLDTVSRSEEGVPMKVYLPDGGVLMGPGKDPKPVEIVMFGPDGKHCAALARKRRKEAQRIATEITDPDDAQEAQEGATLDFLAGMVKSWNVTLTNGQPAPYDRETVKRFFRRFPPAREQAELFVTNRANFVKPPSNN